MENSKQIWSLKLFFLVVGSLSSLMVSFLPIYFQNKGFTTSEIGMFLGVGTFVGLFSQPFWGVMSDKLKTVKKIILIILIGVIIGIIWIFQLQTLVWLFVAGSFFYFFFNALHPLSENLAKRTADEHKISFGGIRSWNSFGFAFVSLASGYAFEKFGVEYLSYPLIAAAMISFLLAFGLTDANSGTKRVKIKEMLQVFKNPTLLLFFFLIIFISLPHRVNDSFISLYLYDIGGNEALVGWLWFIGVLSEAVLYFTSHLWFKPDHPLKFIIIAAVLFTLRWLVIGFISDPIILVMFQFLHGICFAVMYLGALEYLYRAVPLEMQATGHMVFMIIAFGITNIIGSSAGGFIFEKFGGGALYHTLAVISFIGLLAFIFFNMKEKSNQKMEVAHKLE